MISEVNPPTKLVTATVPVPAANTESGFDKITQHSQSLKLSTLVDQLVDKIDSTPEFSKNVRAQISVLDLVFRDYERFNELTKQRIKQKIIPKIPRLSLCADPQSAFEDLLYAYQLFPGQGMMEISKSLKSYGPKPDYINDLDEGIYPRTGWIGAYLEHAKDCEAPLSFQFWAAISLIGTCCRFKFWLDRGKYELQLNNYILLSTEVAGGKSIAKDISQDIIHRINQMLNKPDEFKTDQHLGTINLLAEDSTKEATFEDLQFREKYTTDANGIPRVVTVDSCGTFIIDELSNFLGRQSFQVETKIPFLTSLYGSKHPFKKSTKSSGRFEIRNAAVSLIACAAPSWLTDSITPIMFTGGFLDRFRIIYRNIEYAPRCYSKPPPSDPCVANKLAEKMLPICNILEPYEMINTENAEACFDKWYRKEHHHRKTSLDRFNLSVQRMGNQILKLAATLAISEGTRPLVHTPQMEMAISIICYEETHLNELMLLITQPPESAKSTRIELNILQNGGSIGKRALRDRMRKWKGFMPLAKVGDRLLDDLVDAGRLEIVSDKDTKAQYYTLTAQALSELATREKLIGHVKKARIIKELGIPHNRVNIEGQKVLAGRAIPKKLMDEKDIGLRSVAPKPDDQ